MHLIANCDSLNFLSNPLSAAIMNSIKQTKFSTFLRKHDYCVACILKTNKVRNLNKH